MKTKQFILLAGIVLLSGTILFLGCKKKKEKPDNDTYVCTTCTTQPQGKAENDNISKGIYKGVIIGSSGTIKFDIGNASYNTIMGKIVIDGQEVILSTQYSWQAGQLLVAPFTGTLNGQPVSLTLSIAANGTNVQITSSNIPGHPNAVFSIAKETSTVLVRCFEGTYEKPTEKGTFNIIISTLLKGWIGKARQNGSSSTTDISGNFANETLYWGAGDSNKIAPLNGDSFSGSFKDDNNVTVTVKGKRTL